MSFFFGRLPSIVGGLALCAASPAPAPLFGETFSQFKVSLDRRIQEDAPSDGPTGSTIQSCAKKSGTYTCTFHGRGFQRQVDKFRELGLVQGVFRQKIGIKVETSNDKVFGITLTGDRSDPANLLWFVGTVMNIMQIADPDVGKAPGSSKALVDALGIMRGDDAFDIGAPRSLDTDYARISCTTRPSATTFAVVCEFSQKP